MLTVRRLVWDGWNVAHIARQAVTPDEVEEVCHGDPEMLSGHSGRILSVGPTAGGRVLTVVLAPQGRGVYYPVTARPASRKERVYHAVQKGDGTP